MQSIKQFGLLVIILAVGFFVKTQFFPDEAGRIQKRLNELSSLLTKPEGENLIGTANKITRAVDFFHAPIVVTWNRDKDTAKTVNEQDKARIKESISAIKFHYSWVNVRFQDVQTAVDGQTATSQLVARLEFQSKEQGPVYDLYGVWLELQKVEGQWLISRLDIQIEDQGKKD